MAATLVSQFYFFIAGPHNSGASSNLRCHWLLLKKIELAGLALFAGSLEADPPLDCPFQRVLSGNRTITACVNSTLHIPTFKVRTMVYAFDM